MAEVSDFVVTAWHWIIDGIVANKSPLNGTLKDLRKKIDTVL